MKFRSSCITQIWSQALVSIFLVKLQAFSDVNITFLLGYNYIVGRWPEHETINYRSINKCQTIHLSDHYVITIYSLRTLGLLLAYICCRPIENWIFEGALCLLCFYSCCPPYLQIMASSIKRQTVFSQLAIVPAPGISSAVSIFLIQSEYIWRKHLEMI